MDDAQADGDVLDRETIWNVEREDLLLQLQTVRPVACNALAGSYWIILDRFRHRRTCSVSPRRRRVGSCRSRWTLVALKTRSESCSYTLNVAFCRSRSAMLGSERETPRQGIRSLRISRLQRYSSQLAEHATCAYNFTAYNRQQGAVIHSDYAPRFTAIVTRNGQMTAFCSEAERRTKAQVHLTRRRRRRARRSAMTRSFRCCVRGHWPSRAGTLLAANQRGRFCTHLTMGWRDCPARRCEVAWCRRSLAHRQHWRVRVAPDRHTQCK
jgi:hypothetical protein